MWVFENMCVAVACEEASESSCLPIKVTSKDTTMAYVEINHTPANRQLEEILQLLGTSDSNKEEDSPPLAHAGPKEMTVHVLASDSYVYLYGNKSTDDKVHEPLH